MNFRLEAEEQVGETSVLGIRREGRYTKRPSTSVVTERQGITLFAWNRGTVLEDRFQDSIVEAGESSSSQVGTITQTVTRLVRSCPTWGT